MEYILIFIARAICHQIPDRSILIGGNVLPFCARCTGIYIGIFVSFAFLIIRKRLSANKPFSIFVAISASFLLMSMVLDALTSYTGLRTTNNFNRIISGVLFGLNMPLFYTLANNFKSDAENEKTITSSGEYWAIIGVGLTMTLLIYSGFAVSWVFVSVLLTASMLVTLCSVTNFIFKYMLNIKTNTRYVLSFVCSLIVIATISIWNNISYR